VQKSLRWSLGELNPCVEYSSKVFYMFSYYFSSCARIYPR